MVSTRLTFLVANQPGRSLNLTFTEEDPTISLILQHISDLLSHAPDNCLGYNRDLQEDRLYINGVHMETIQKPISDYRIFGSTLTYYSRPLPRLSPFRSTAPSGMLAQTLTGKTIHLPYDPQFTIRELKELLEASEGTPAVRLRLLAPGLKELDNTLTMASCGLGMGDKVYIVYQRSGQSMPGGGVAIFDLDDKADTTITTTVATTDSLHFSRHNFIETEIPPGSMAGGGTNIECYCQCQPTHRVICPQGLGFTELNLPPQTRCPCCHQPDKMTKPRLVGFVECKFRFHGIRAGSGEQFSSNWTLVNKEDGYQCYDLIHYSQGLDRLVVESTHLSRFESCLVCLKTVSSQDVHPNDCGHWVHEQCYRLLDKGCPGCQLNQCLKFGGEDSSCIGSAKFLCTE